MAIEIVSFPMKNGWIFPVRYVKLPEGKPNLGRISSNFLMVSGVLRFLIGPYHGDWGSGWWLTKHLEKYDFANGKNYIPYSGKSKIFETTNQIYIYTYRINNGLIYKLRKKNSPYNIQTEVLSNRNGITSNHKWVYL